MLVVLSISIELPLITYTISSKLKISMIESLGSPRHWSRVKYVTEIAKNSGSSCWKVMWLKELIPEQFLLAKLRYDKQGSTYQECVTCLLECGVSLFFMLSKPDNLGRRLIWRATKSFMIEFKASCSSETIEAGISNDWLIFRKGSFLPPLYFVYPPNIWLVT